MEVIIYKYQITPTNHPCNYHHIVYCFMFRNPSQQLIEKHLLFSAVVKERMETILFARFTIY